MIFLEESLMISSSQEVKLIENFEFEFTVSRSCTGGVGGGVVASRLAENQNWKILVIEAGPS